MSGRQSTNLGRTFHPMSQCTGKSWFRSYDAAKSAALNLSRMEGEEDGEIRPYYCRYCGCYHVGHRPA